jgi:hypothetical protein
MAECSDSEKRRWDNARPSYSPDLNPIENMWSKVKQLPRGMETRTNYAPEKGIAGAFDLLCASDAQGWFKNCGYELFQV